MKRLIKADAIQLVTTRTALSWAIVVMGFMTVGTIVLLIRAPMQLSLHDLAQNSGRDIVIVLTLLFSLITVTANYRHRVAVTEQLIAPSMWQAIVSKLIVFGLCGALVFAAKTAVISVLFAVWPGAGLDVSISDVGIVGFAALAGAIAAMFGVAIGRLFRQQVLALMCTGAYLIFAETAFSSPQVMRILGISEEWHKQLLPFVPGQAFKDMLFGTGSTPVFAALILLSWVGQISALAYLLDRKREWQ